VIERDLIGDRVQGPRPVDGLVSASISGAAKHEMVQQGMGFAWWVVAECLRAVRILRDCHGCGR